MTRGQYYSRVMPVLGILYVIVILVLDHQTKVVTVGALVLALAAVAAPWFTRSPADGEGRDRRRNRLRKP
jgi:hypothetical protein